MFNQKSEPMTRMFPVNIALAASVLGSARGFVDTWTDLSSTRKLSPDTSKITFEGDSGSCVIRVKEAVMQSAELRKRRRGNTQQEPQQRRSVGITWQSSEVLKDSVLAEQLGCLDAVEPEEHGIEQRQKYLTNTIAMVALSESNIRGERVLVPALCQEAMQHIDAAVMRQRTGTKRNCKPTCTFGHPREPYLEGSFHWKRLASTENSGHSA